MISVSLKKLNALKNNFKGKRIAVVGDLMLDCYYWGGVSRISPEAPVPILQVDNEFYRFGGAMNVAYNISTLGGIPFPIGIIGNDNEGKIFKNLLREKKISDKGIVVDSKRPTTAKTRVIADKQHVVRIDKEKTNAISPLIERKILALLSKEINKLDAIILQDYNKGVLTESLIEQIITLAHKAKKIITVDPKFLNFFSYQNVTVFKPNRKETEDAFGIWIRTDEEISKAGQKLLERLNCKYVLLTLGENGIALFEKDKPERRVPTKARSIADVSGAGDTVISTLTMALSAGADIFDATYLANYAGGLVCQEVGIIPIELDNLFNAVAGELK
jgi:rfaE bifunctional protein kinase chain/domain